MDDFDSLTDEQIQELIALGALPDQQAAIQQQLEQAQYLRDQAMQAPQMRGNGRVQTAANPLEFLAAGLQGYRANKDIKTLQEQQAEILRQQATGRGKYFGRYFDSPERRARHPAMQDVGVDPLMMPQGNF